jgi:basic amino acid/polyamine antiporter, APA family
MKSGLGPPQIFTIAFGSSVGVGWIVLSGEWIRQAGPLGAASAFILGGLLVTLIALAYAEMASRHPIEGGEAAYANLVFGPKLGFIVAWLLLLAYLGIVAFEAVSVGWVITALFDIRYDVKLYEVGGNPINVVAILGGLLGGFFLIWLNSKRIETAAKVQDYVTWGKVIIAGLFVLGAVLLGSGANLAPAWPDFSTRDNVAAALMMAATAPYFMSGFNSGGQALGHRRAGVSINSSVMMLVLAVIAATAFYVLIPVAAALSLPRETLLASAFPTADAASAIAGGEWGGKAILIAGLLGLLSTWNGVIIGTLQLMRYMTKVGYLTPGWTAENDNGVPKGGLMLCLAVSIVSVFVGKAVLLPVISTGTICYFVAFGIVAAGALRLRRDNADAAPFQTPGGRGLIIAALACSAIIALSAFASPLLAGGLPLEWSILAFWAVVGTIIWSRLLISRESTPTQ